VVHRHNGGGDAAASTPKPTAAAVSELKPTITSYAAVGSGFRHDGSAWDTQRYNTPEFAGLKDGVGLILDLGSPASVSAVSFDAGSGPLRVELRSADSRPGSITGWTKVTSNSSASGQTTLDGSKGGKHEYWMIWVTRLGSDNKATISDITVKGLN
jgi:hypothetical protein